MLLILLSTALFSASVATSPLAFGPVVAVPPGADPAEPVVLDDDPLETDEPDELTVPELLVPAPAG